MHKIYNNIKKIREHKDIPQKEMAKKLNIAQNNYGRLERGEIQMTVERLEEISKIFKMTPVEIYEHHLKEVQDKNICDEHLFNLKKNIYINFQDQINFGLRTSQAIVCFSYTNDLRNTGVKFAPLKEKITEEKFKEYLLYQTSFKFFDNLTDEEYQVLKEAMDDKMNHL